MRYMRHVPGCIRTSRECICVEKASTASKDDDSSRGQLPDAERKCVCAKERDGGEGRERESERGREKTVPISIL